MIDSNANGPGELLAQTSSLIRDYLHQKITKYLLQKSLDLLKCESAASPLLEVVLVGRARDHRPQLSNGAGGNLKEMSFIQSGIYEQMKYTRSVLESDLFTLAAFATLFWRLRIFLAGWNMVRLDSDQSD